MYMYLTIENLKLNCLQFRGTWVWPVFTSVLWCSFCSIRRVWRYQRCNQNPNIEEEQTTQWPKEKVQKNKQRSTKHTYKTKDRVIRTLLKSGGELSCSGRVGSSYSIRDTRRVNLVTNPVYSFHLFRVVMTIVFSS